MGDCINSTPSGRKASFTALAIAAGGAIAQGANAAVPEPGTLALAAALVAAAAVYRGLRRKSAEA